MPPPDEISPDHPRPLVELLSLALPTVAQMASYTIMQFIDVWILSRLGGAAPTAVSNAGLMAVSALGFGMGVTNIVNTLVSQSFGRGEWRDCGKYLWQGIWFALLYGVVLLPLIGLGHPLFSFFHHPPDQAGMEAVYFRIVIMASGIKLVSMALGQFMLGINRPGAVLVSAVFGVTINAVAAWAMVLGHLGFKPAGVHGAAWAQNIGVSCELLMLVVFALHPSVRKRFGVLDARLRPRAMLLLARIGMPSGMQWLGDILAWSIFCNAVMGALGPVAMQANTFMMRYMIMCFMPALGISAAVTALVGRYIGRGRPDIAAQRASMGFSIALAYMFACGTCFYFFRYRLISIFSSDPEVIRVGAIYLTYAAVYELFDAMYIIYSGALRGAGDTLVPAIVTATLCWTITVGGGFAAALYLPRLGYGGPWLVATAYGAILGLFMRARFAAGGWKRIRLSESPNSNVAISSATLSPS